MFLRRGIAGRVVVLALVTLASAACGSKEAAVERRTATSATATTSSPGSSPGMPVPPGPSPAAAPAASAPRIVVLGDSLTAGLGISADEAYPAVLQQHLRADGLDYEIVNAGVSGDTSAGGLSRLDWALDGDVRVLVVALGGNDGLRGLPPDELTRNLAQIIERAQARHITVVLAGMEAPPNFGQEYTSAFHQVYPALAKKYHLALVPFLLQGVAGDVTLNQPDGLHPTVRGARIVADNVWAILGPMLEGQTRRD